MMVMGGIERATRARHLRGARLFVAFCLFPFLWMVDTALKPAGEVRSLNPTFWIVAPTLDNFSGRAADDNFLIYFRNSVIVAGGTTILTLIVSVFCGYALSRLPRQPCPARSAARCCCRR